MKNSFLFLLFLLASLTSCQNDHTDDLEKAISYDVYLGGVDEYNACYWKNGQKILLSGGENLQGTHIVVENNNVYMLANNIEGLGNTVPAWFFWKNGVKYDVAQYLNVAPNTSTETNKLQIWNNMTVKNGDIYFTGVIKNPSPTSASDQYQFCSWKNGVKTVLESLPESASVGCIGIYNNDFYVTKRGSTSIVGGVQTWDIGYYHNNTYTYLTSNLIPRYFISDASGFYLFLRSTDAYKTITVKNIANNTNLPIPASIASSGINNISWDHADKYYIGDSFYYKNNTLIQINDPNNYNNIGQFVAKDQNIYMTRYNSNSGGTGVKFYINNVEAMSLPNITKSCFNSIFVVPN